MTGKGLSLIPHFVLAAATAGCFSSATMRQLQDANRTYSISPNFKLDRNWRIAILPPQKGDVELPALHDHAGLLLMQPGCFTLIDRAEVERVLREQRSREFHILDPHGMRRLGRLMNAEAVVTISVTKLEHDDFFKDDPDQRDAQIFVKILSVKTAEALYYAEGRSSSFEGPDAALSSALSSALQPLIRSQRS